MPHMVIFRNNEGKPGYHQAEALDDAVRFVEHLRNQEQVSDARIFSMQEVPIEFKTYYKVEVGVPAAAPAAVEDSPSAEPEAMASEAAEENPDEMAGAGLAAANARFGRFNRS